MTSHADMLRRFEDAKANNAIEGLILTDEEEALFRHMIDQGLDSDQRKQMIDDFLSGELDVPLRAAAE